MVEKERKEKEAKDVVGQFGGGVGTGAKKMDPEEKARLKAQEKAEKEAKKAAEKAEKEAEKARLKAEKEEKARLEKLEKEEKKRIAEEEKAEKARQAQILKEEAERIKSLEKAQKEKEKEDKAREKAAAAAAAAAVDPEQANAAAKIQSIVRAKEARNEVESLKEGKKKNITVHDITRQTGIKYEDITSTLHSLNLIKAWKGQHVVSIAPDYIEKQRKQTKQIRLCNPSCLSWTPPPKMENGLHHNSRK
jgi:hypothetical protein